MKKNNTPIILFALIVNIFVDHYFFLIGTKSVFIIHFFLFFLWKTTNIIQKQIMNNKKPILMNTVLMNFLRIISCVVFLFSPTVFYNQNIESNYIVNFFVIYFCYSFLEILKKTNSIK